MERGKRQAGCWAPAGILNFRHAAELWHRLRAAQADSPFDVDLRHVTAVDGSGVQLLAALYGELAHRGYELRLVGRSPVVEEALKLYGLDSFGDDDSLIPGD